jgi:hypothetical protein
MMPFEWVHSEDAIEVEKSRVTRYILQNTLREDNDICVSCQVRSPSDETP